MFWWRIRGRHVEVIQVSFVVEAGFADKLRVGTNFGLVALLVANAVEEIVGAKHVPNRVLEVEAARAARLAAQLEGGLVLVPHDDVVGEAEFAV